MSFQGYLDAIRAKTGLGADDFSRLAAERGLAGPGVKAGAVIDWLAADYGLGRGHAMAIVAVLKDAMPASAADAAGAARAIDDAVDAVFSGPRRVWRATFETIWQEVSRLGEDVGLQPTKQYVGLTRAGRKFAIVAPTAARLDIGIKLDPGEDSPRLAPAGSWNSMVTHRAQLFSADELDTDLLGLLAAAYDRAGS
ncbi:MAG TPA: DUF4287 domain-containing protein [Jiangellaceae bacterium]